ncbi:uncharacterized protein BJ212DRAFT_1373156 [Suillus subaureus]|uniref:Uncharacterized protein n=1 Tax=Suillus subaureus TaxID=48587 RepID=A0A9P7E6C6_9AGAM|nr:uncharacterized protein BJ212DRAFT_1373156 [Suillus subaureus]KAG1811799.1 hypothetical protein BJ212DRAFT_1373156 [Suillus subaureus]
MLVRDMAHMAAHSAIQTSIKHRLMLNSSAYDPHVMLRCVWSWRLSTHVTFTHGWMSLGVSDIDNLNSLV